MTTAQARVVLADENLTAKSHLQNSKLPKEALEYLTSLSEALDMADKALKENEELKAQINRCFREVTNNLKTKNDHDEQLLDCIEQLQKENERLKADRAGLIEDIERWNEASHEHHKNIKKAKEKIENKATYDGIYIDRADVLKVLDELTEGEIENER